MFAKLNKSADLIEKILSLFGILSFVFLIIVVVLQIFTRLFLPVTFAWTEEISRLLFLYMIAFMAPVALKARELVLVDMLTLYFPKVIQKILNIFIDILILVLSLVMLFTTPDYVLLGVGQIAPASQLPTYIMYFSMAILTFFLSLYSVFLILNHINSFTYKGAN